MNYFTEEMRLFFRELRENNHKEWFDANKKRYEKEVKQPFRLLVSDLLQRLKELDSLIQDDASKSIFRINRDIRFSKDKTPYKTHLAAALSRSGRKPENPGFYIFCNDEKLSIGGGHYSPSKEQLYQIRQEIIYNDNEFNQIINDNTFKVLYKGLREPEKNKVLPKEMKEAGKKQPILYYKGFWYMKDLPAETALSETLVDDLWPYFAAAAPVNAFFYRAISQQ